MTSRGYADADADADADAPPSNRPITLASIVIPTNIVFSSHTTVPPPVNRRTSVTSRARASSSRTSSPSFDPSPNTTHGSLAPSHIVNQHSRAR